MGNASLRDFRGGEGTYVADALERSLLLPVDMAELGNLRRQEVFLSLKRYLGMLRLLTLMTPLNFVLWFYLFQLAGHLGHL
mgnify:CR=1 FL=1